MVGEMKWDSTPGASGRRQPGPNARKNNQKHKKHPRAVEKELMSTTDRQSIIRAMKYRSEILRACWRPRELQNLPALNLALLQTKTPELAFVDIYRQLWNWQDDCLAIMRHYKTQDPPPPYDFGPFEAAFSGVSRLSALRGSYYTACSEALELRQRGMNPASAAMSTVQASPGAVASTSMAT